MPTFDYRCLNDNCNYRFEYVIALSKRDEKVECPQCKNKTTKRLIGAPSMVIAENDNPISPKPDSYWNNAEEVRIKEKLGRLKENKEKEFYGDKDFKPSVHSV
jgi:putative FmdB family regulatory protein